ncbi:MAG: ABC transporter permease [Propionibacteriaceae bacterium]|nr:ABC transporter permease [Propionibacteriaceae bacterium]
MKPRTLFREAWATAVAARGFSWFFGLIVLAAVVVVELLAGQAEAQRQEVAAVFSRAEYRTAEVIDGQGLGVIPWDTVQRARQISAVTSAWAASAAFEVHGTAIPERGVVSARQFTGDWKDLPISLTTGRFPAGPNEALVDEATAATLGVDPSGGAVMSPDGREWALVGTFVPLHGRAPSMVIVPATADTQVRSISFTVSRLSQLDSTASLVVSLTDATSPAVLTVDRSMDARRLDSAVSGTVAEFGLTIVVTTMATSAVVLTLLSAMMVHTRRQEFGRRRALGATRSDVLALVLLHGTIIVAIAGLLGLTVGAAVNWLQFGVMPSPALLGATLSTAVCGSAIAQIPAALIAGYRDPVRILRTP